MALILVAAAGAPTRGQASDQEPRRMLERRKVTRTLAPPAAAAPAAKPDSAPPAAAEKKPAKVERTKKFGSSAGDAYKRGGKDTEAWIIGFDRTKGVIQGKTMIGMLEPVYTRKEGEELETEDRIVAKEGYAVGQIELDVDTFLRAVRLTFYRLKDGKLDPTDSYQSRWVGKRRNKRPQKLPSHGEKIVGIYGSADEAIRSIGLLVVKQ